MNPTKIITLGPTGSFHELAARNFYPDAALILVNHPQQIFEKVQAGMGPGLIAQLDTYSDGINDQLRKLATDFTIIEERTMPISLCLAAAAQTKESAVETVMSHPQAFSFVAGLLLRAYPKLTLQACESTSAAAAELTKSMKPYSAVLCHPDTAAAYGLRILLDAENLGGKHSSVFTLFTGKA